MNKTHSSDLNGLPPSKRFKFLNLHHQLLLQSNANPPSLPAKKRLTTSQFDIPSPIGLPAKKRVWAPHPLEKKHQADQPILPKIKKPIHFDHPASEEDEDDGVICAVCQSTDGDPADPIVFCDGCDLMVHASCYGDPLATSVPDGDWFCDQCQDKDTIGPIMCCLCPAEGGAMKRTCCGKWAHISCALFVPEVFFREPEGRCGIDCSEVPLRRWEKGCYLCEGIGVGCVVECCESKCELGFHVGCGLERGVCFEYKEGKCGTVVAGFCEEHTRLWKKQQLTGKFKIVAAEKGKI